jgi:hypothetical protein
MADAKVMYVMRLHGPFQGGANRKFITNEYLSYVFAVCMCVRACIYV